MARTRPLCLTLAAFAALAAAPPRADDAGLAAQLIALEKQSWVAWQKQDASFWRSFLSDDHVELDMGAGAVGKKEVIGAIEAHACTVAGYTVDHFTMRRLDADTALLIYRAEQDTSCGGHKVPAPVWATTLYERRGGRWVNAYYSQTPIPKRN